jgi:hypothetical protein
VNVTMSKRSGSASVRSADEAPEWKPNGGARIDRPSRTVRPRNPTTLVRESARGRQTPDRVLGLCRTRQPPDCQSGRSPIAQNTGNRAKSRGGRSVADESRSGLEGDSISQYSIYRCKHWLFSAVKIVNATRSTRSWRWTSSALPLGVERRDMLSDRRLQLSPSIGVIGNGIEQKWHSSAGACRQASERVPDCAVADHGRPPVPGVRYISSRGDIWELGASIPRGVR